MSAAETAMRPSSSTNTVSSAVTTISPSVARSNASAGRGSSRPLEGLEEDVDRADMSDREGSAGDDGSWDDRPETDGSEAQRPLVADRGVRDRGGGDLLVLSPRSAIVSSHGAV